MNGTLLSLEDVWVGYGAVDVVRGVSLKVGTGEIVALLGANGIGKTTLNNALSGLIPVRRGRVVFAAEDVTNWRPEQFVAAGLIHVPEGRRIFPNLSVEENLDLGSFARARASRKRNRDHVYDIFPRLLERRKQAAGTLSGGERQMLAIGRGLMAEPMLLILDEPSLGLAPLVVEQMFELIRRINAEGISILLVEQNLAQSLEIARRGLIMEQGTITLEGDADALAADPRVKAAYLGL
jgi:branched-chain amino acid transport system ATP-binding protein